MGVCLWTGETNLSDLQLPGMLLPRASSSSTSRRDSRRRRPPQQQRGRAACSPRRATRAGQHELASHGGVVVVEGW